MAREIYDYVGLPFATAQHNKTLSLSPTIVGGIPVRESATKIITIHESINGQTEERISWQDSGEFKWYVYIRYDSLIDVDAQTLLDFWFDPLYGDGSLYTFYFASPDGHTYIVRFDQDTFDANMLNRYIMEGDRGFGSLKLKILGKKAE